MAPRFPRREWRGRLSTLYVVTVFLGSALLFVLEPMFARMVLPKLGGSPSVWNTAMVFFQAALLAGYAYSHWLTRRVSVRRQRWVQLTVLALPLLMLPIRLPVGWTPPTALNPIPWLLALLTVAIGLPFIAVSTGPPLLQRWFSTTRATTAGDPYFLYAASNAGSLLGLLAYPFLIEPHLTLGQQSRAWSIGYAALVLLTAVCALAVGRKAAEPDAAADSKAARVPAAISTAQRLRWLALAFAPSSLMLGVTQHLSAEVAAVPLLWVAPLAIYLASFVLVFSRRPVVPWTWVARAVPLAVLVLMTALLFDVDHPLTVVMAIHLGGLFVLATACHGALAASRPAPERLTEFYLWMALGGACGGIFNALIAPVVFSSILEYPLAIGFAAMICPAPWARADAASEPNTRERRLDFAVPAVAAAMCAAFMALTRSVSEFRGQADTRLIPVLLMVSLGRFAARPLRFGLGILALYLVGHVEAGTGERVLVRERTFFGVHKVVEEAGTSLHYLFHGVIIHGIQSTRPERRDEPLSYYHRGGPMGRAIEALGPKDAPRHVAVVGLGAGSLAAYARPADTWTFYEIDPTVVRIASTPAYFSFLHDCKAPFRIVLGDARRSLEADGAARFDLMVLDAYSSDAIPVHLLTREALRLYVDRLAPGGVLVFHISSRHFRLAPVVAGLARDAGLAYRMCDDDPLTPAQLARGWNGSTVAVVARTAGDFGTLLADRRWHELPGATPLTVWTDDYSSLVGVLAWR